MQNEGEGGVLLLPGRKRFVATKFLDSSSVDAVGIPPGNRRMT